MPPTVTRFVTSALLALPLAVLACLSALSEPAPTGGAPSAVTEEAEAQPTPEAPVKVVIGAYINDIQEPDFKTNSYAIDLYVIILTLARVVMTSWRGEMPKPKHPSRAPIASGSACC